MAHACYPAIFRLDDGTYCCQMKDKKTGRVWGEGFGENRWDAISAARTELPSDSRIKQAIGWVTHHPLIGGAAVGLYITYRNAEKHGINPTVKDYLSGAAVVGGICWVASKVVKFIKHLINR